MTWKYPQQYDVIIIGGGHAGCEAAHASAKMGVKTLLLTMNISTIAQMSCNPSVGGIGKGHIVREIDALGGLMGKVTDLSSIQFRMLNTKKGPAVQAPRAQADKDAYKTCMRMRLEATENLFIKQATVEEILVENGAVVGVLTKEHIIYTAQAIVLTSGTFMQGLLHIGDVNFSGGRAGEAPAVGLSKNLLSLGIKLGRLKTGTPVRVHKRSIDFSCTEEQHGDSDVRFSFDPPEGKRMQQVPCHITYTTEETKAIIKANLHRSPLYSGKIVGVGPRYCPSIEDKVVRFADKDRHQIFLEPESLTSVEVYVNGVSSSLPFDVQYAFIRSIPALKNAEIMRPGYAIEYDYIVSGQVDCALESRSIRGLFFAGQINGTTGYEEAAGQGLIAGINAASKVANIPSLILKRSESYIAVMLDDLVTKGVDEPYRMFTSRAEHRLLLRQDNADLRLRKYGYERGLISSTQYQVLCKKEETIALEQRRLNLIYRGYDGKNCSLAQLLCRPEISYDDLMHLFPDDVVNHGIDTNQQIKLNLMYEGYIRRQQQEVDKLEHAEGVQLPAAIDYATIHGLRTEARLRLSQIRPAHLGQASRIPGISPADITVLRIYLQSYASNISTQS